MEKFRPCGNHVHPWTSRSSSGFLSVHSKCVSWSLGGVVGLIVGLTTYLQIQYTSSLSHNISGVMKNCIQVNSIHIHTFFFRPSDNISNDIVLYRSKSISHANYGQRCVWNCAGSVWQHFLCQGENDGDEETNRVTHHPNYFQSIYL